MPPGGGGASPRHVGACPLGLRGCCGASSPQAVGAPVAGAGVCVAASPRVVGGRVGLGGGVLVFREGVFLLVGGHVNSWPRAHGDASQLLHRWFLLCVCLWGGGVAKRVVFFRGPWLGGRGRSLEGELASMAKPSALSHRGTTAEECAGCGDTRYVPWAEGGNGGAVTQVTVLGNWDEKLDPRDWLVVLHGLVGRRGKG